MEAPLAALVGCHGGRIYYQLSNIHAVLQAAPAGDFLSDAFSQFVGAEPAAPASREGGWVRQRRGRLREWGELLWMGRQAFRRLRKVDIGVARFERAVPERVLSETHQVVR